MTGARHKQASFMSKVDFERSFALSMHARQFNGADIIQSKHSDHPGASISMFKCDRGYGIARVPLYVALRIVAMISPTDYIGIERCRSCGLVIR